MPKTGSKKSEAVKQAVVSKRLAGESKRKISRDLEINRQTVDNILDESQIEAALAQWRQNYMELVPSALDILRRFLADGKFAPEIDKDTVSAALQVLKGTGIHEERLRSRSEVKVTRDLTNASDAELDNAISQLLARPQ
jgi:hypothetical protein